MKGVNLTENSNEDLKAWYQGPTLTEVLGTVVYFNFLGSLPPLRTWICSADEITPPLRDLEGPICFPIPNVFRGGTGGISAGLGISGRLCTGVLQVGKKLRVLPGDEIAVVRSAFVVPFSFLKI